MIKNLIILKKNNNIDYVKKINELQKSCETNGFTNKMKRKDFYKYKKGVWVYNKSLDTFIQIYDHKKLEEYEKENRILQYIECNKYCSTLFKSIILNNFKILKKKLDNISIDANDLNNLENIKYTKKDFFVPVKKKKNKNIWPPKTIYKKNYKIIEIPIDHNDYEKVSVEFNLTDNSVLTYKVDFYPYIKLDDFIESYDKLNKEYKEILLYHSEINYSTLSKSLSGGSDTVTNLRKRIKLAEKAEKEKVKAEKEKVKAEKAEEAEKAEKKLINKQKQRFREKVMEEMKNTKQKEEEETKIKKKIFEMLDYNNRGYIDIDSLLHFKQQAYENILYDKEKIIDVLITVLEIKKVQVKEEQEASKDGKQNKIDYLITKSGTLKLTFSNNKSLGINKIENFTYSYTLKDDVKKIDRWDETDYYTKINNEVEKYNKKIKDTQCTNDDDFRIEYSKKIKEELNKKKEQLYKKIIESKKKRRRN